MEIYNLVGEFKPGNESCGTINLIQKFISGIAKSNDRIINFLNPGLILSGRRKGIEELHSLRT